MIEKEIIKKILSNQKVNRSNLVKIAKITTDIKVLKAIIKIDPSCIIDIDKKAYNIDIFLILLNINPDIYLYIKNQELIVNEEVIKNLINKNINNINIIESGIELYTENYKEKYEIAYDLAINIINKSKSLA